MNPLEVAFYVSFRRINAVEGRCRLRLGNAVTSSERQWLPTKGALATLVLKQLPPVLNGDLPGDSATFRPRVVPLPDNSRNVSITTPVLMLLAVAQTTTSARFRTAPEKAAGSDSQLLSAFTSAKPQVLAMNVLDRVPDNSERLESGSDVQLIESSPGTAAGMPLSAGEGESAGDNLIAAVAQAPPLAPAADAFLSLLRHVHCH